jgi:hypothetical protein
VELAVTLPLLVLIVLGTIESCAMIYLTQSLHIAAYEGARVSLIPKSSALNVTDAANQIITDRRIKSSTITITPTDFKNAPLNSPITVRVTAPVSANCPLTPLFFAGRTMAGSCTMMKEY